MNMMRYVIGTVGMIHMITIMSMEPETMKITKQPANKQYDFVDLISNNGAVVKKLVAEEQRTFCPQLLVAEKIL